MKRGTIKALAIDFDGVLVDSQPMHYQAWQKVFAQMNLSMPLTAQEVVGLSVEAFVAALPLPADSAQKMAQLKKELVIRQSRLSPPPLYPFVKSTLQRLSGSFQLVLVSSVEKPVAIHTLRHHGIFDLFSAIILEGDYEKPKPCPEPYLAGLARLQLPAREVMAIEDSEIGLASAQAAQLRTIAIANTSARARLRKADHIIARFDQIVPIVECESKLSS